MIDMECNAQFRSGMPIYEDLLVLKWGCNANLLKVSAIYSNMPIIAVRDTPFTYPLYPTVYHLDFWVIHPYVIYSGVSF